MKIHSNTYILQKLYYLHHLPSSVSAIPFSLENALDI